MPAYPEGFTAEEYDELRQIVVEVGQDGPFNANDLLAAYVTRGTTVSGRFINAGSVAQILDDLSELGVLRALGGDPPRWELAS